MFGNKGFLLNMSRRGVPKPEVAESTKYENFVAESNLVEKEPPPPIEDDTTYPFTLKVHIDTAKSAQRFAELMKRTLRAMSASSYSQKVRA